MNEMWFKVSGIHSKSGVVNYTRDSNKPCDAFKCNFKPSEKVSIGCGIYGKITIFVCKSCSQKFNIGDKQSW